MLKLWEEDFYIRLYRGLGHCGVGSYISQPVCRAGAIRAPVVSGAGETPAFLGVGAGGGPGAVGAGASLASPLLSVSGIASNVAGAFRTLGVAGIEPAGAGSERCFGSMLCVAPSGQCCVLRISLRGPPECPPSC